MQSVTFPKRVKKVKFTKTSLVAHGRTLATACHVKMGSQVWHSVTIFATWKIKKFWETFAAIRVVHPANVAVLHLISKPALINVGVMEQNMVKHLRLNLAVRSANVLVQMKNQMKVHSCIFG